MKIRPLFIALGIFLFQCTEPTPPENDTPSVKLTSYVDPYIGTGFHGHVFLGANVPFGAMQLGPTNLTQGWDWCSGYHYSDTTLIGFSHTHLSGTGIGDLGDILVLPTSGAVNLVRGDKDNLQDGYLAFYDHTDENVKPGYYGIYINKYKVQAELTTTSRVGFHRYTYAEGTDANVVVDLERGIGWDSPYHNYIEQVNDSTVAGFRWSKGWAVNQKIFFSMVFSKPIQNFTLSEEVSADSAGVDGRKVKAGITFGQLNGVPLMIKVAISPVSIENAQENMKAELPGWDFEKVATAADEAWEKELSRIRVTMENDDQMKLFYTSLYHSMIAPSAFQDVNGAYRGADAKNYVDKSYTNYTTFSLWDTYRAAHPLYSLTQRERVADFVKTFLNIYKQQGKLPIWHLVGNETDCMVGYPSIPVIADAYFKGIPMDAELAFEAMKASSMRDDYGMKYIKEKGYIPADLEKESVSKALEYCLSDWCIAQVAKSLGKEEDYAYYSKRAKAYEIYFDKKTHFMRAKLDNGEFRTPFDPFNSIHMVGDYTEGTAWQYTWLVPHDVEGLVSLFGSEDSFEQKLDSLFEVDGDMGEGASSDITGLVGQYAQGNEPSHHITYLYGYIGKSWKTAEKVRYIMDSLYLATPEGLSGNEDVGQMSSWFILSSLGFYQVNPANGRYVFGSPLVQSATLQVGDGKEFTIKTVNNTHENIYIQSMKLNGASYSKASISYQDIVKGGELVIEMGNTPSDHWGVAKEDWATSPINEIK